MERMTEEEYAKAQAFLLKDIPEEFKGPLSSMAWEDGHYAGYEECLNILRGLVISLEEPIKKYGKRERKDAVDEFIGR